MSLRQRLAFMVLSLSVVLLLLSTHQAWKAWGAKRQAVAMRQCEIVDAALLSAAGEWAIERGSTHGRLQAMEPVSDSIRKFIWMHRHRADSALQVAMAGVGAFRNPVVDSGVTELQGTMKKLNAWRARVDAALQKPRDQRDTALRSGWIAVPTQSIEASGRLRLTLEGGFAGMSPQLVTLQQMQQHAWVMMEYAGRERARISGILSEGKPLTAAQMDLLGGLRGRIGIAWENLGTLLRTPGLQSTLLQQRDTLKSGIMGSLAQTRSQILVAGSTGKPYPLASLEWFGQSTKAIESVRHLLDAIGNIRMGEAQAIEAKASRSLMLHCAILLTGLLMAFVYRTWVFREIIFPLEAMTRAMVTLAGGQLTTEVPCREFRNEVGNMAHALEAFRSSAMDLEDERAAVSRLNLEMQEILDAIDQGLFTFDIQGKTNPQHSSKAREVLGREDFGTATVAEVLHLTEEQQQTFDAWLALVSREHKRMAWRKLVRLNPVQELALDSMRGLGEQTLVRLEYVRMLSPSGELSKIMVLATDVTEERRRSRELEEQKKEHEERVRLILCVAGMAPEDLSLLMDDFERRRDRIKVQLESELNAVKKARVEYPNGDGYEIPVTVRQSVYREIHTIKGNSGALGLDSLAQRAHEFENHLEELGNPQMRREDSLEKMLARLEDVTGLLEQVGTIRKHVFGEDDQSLVRVPLIRLEKLREIVSNAGDKPCSDAWQQISQACEQLDWRLLEEVMRRHSVNVRRLAAKLGKDVGLEIVKQETLVPGDALARLDEALIHVLRNCVDHGIELPEERERLGKGLGIVQFKYHENVDGMTQIDIEDNGRGIDSAALRTKAVSLGLITEEQSQKMTEAESLQLIFHSGLSTAEQVSDISGRGVGMDAVRRGIQEMNGDIQIETEKGKGTRFSIRIPNEV